jgi:hypothetical protein
MSGATSTDSARERRRWLILGVIGLAQVMVILDLTVMNVAPPSAQRAPGFTTVDRQWVVTAYTLAFGSLPGIFALGAVVGGALLRRGPLGQERTPSTAHGVVTTAQTEAGRERVQ